MQDEQITIRSILQMVNRFKFLAICVFVLVCAMGGHLYKSQPIRYKTSALLINEGSTQQNASLQSLAMMAGINMSSAPSSTAYLADYIQTHDFLLQIASRKWRTSTIPTDSISLDSLWNKKVPGFMIPSFSNPSDKADFIVSHLSSFRYLTFVQEKTGGLYKLTCEFEDPRVSYDVCNLVVELMNDWNSNKRRSSARETRSFLEKRLDAGKERLARAENAQRQFKEANQVNTSPYTQLQEVRLTRELQISQEIFLQLSKQYEIALADEIKESNALNVMQKPIMQKYPTSPVQRNWVLIIGAVAIALALLSVFVSDVLVTITHEIRERSRKH